jgi:hypothetical protein
VPVVLNRWRTTRRRVSIVTAGCVITIALNAVLGAATASAAGVKLAPYSKVAATSQPCDAQFHVDPTPFEPGYANSVNAMAAVSANDVWAVGSTSQTHYDSGTLAVHWDGSKWTTVASPGAPHALVSAGFSAVAVVPGTLVNNVWAVGTSGDAPLAALWNGSDWNVYVPPGVPGGPAHLSGVVAISPTDVWAVGFGSEYGTPWHTLIEHYDGTGWSVVPSPNASLTSSDRLLSLSAISAVDIWAAGDSTTAGISRTLIQHWDGTAWSIVASPDVGPGNNALYAVGVLSASDAWAVGSSTNVGGHAETLTEHWNGSIWEIVPSPNIDAGSRTNYLLSLAAISPDSLWAAGYSENTNGNVFDPSFRHPLVEHWDGHGWNVVPSPDGLPAIPHNNGKSSFPSRANAIAATSSTTVWVAGGYADTGEFLPNEYPLFENFCIRAPTVSSVAPLSGNTTGGTTVTITGRDFNYVTGVNFGTKPAAGYTVNSSTSITATTSADVAGSVDVSVTNYGGSSAVSPADLFLFVPPAVSWQQYRLTGSDGVTWQPIDTSALALTITPTVDSAAILTANADLWTANAGVNQDLAIFVSGSGYDAVHPVSWKESGGLNGTFSPNAAAVQAVLKEPLHPTLKAGTTYTVMLEWKANHATLGTIFAGAGAGTPFSPTRLTAELVPLGSIDLQTAVSTAQDALTGSDGSTWLNLDDNLYIRFTPRTTGAFSLSANADLWTQNAGVNQDLGIFIEGGVFTPNGNLYSWKESGGYAGTFSPDAVYVQTLVTLTAGTEYVVRPRWKANHATSGTIRAGAGIGPSFSPTRITAQMIPMVQRTAGSVTYTLTGGESRFQYHKSFSTGFDWTPVDATMLKVDLSADHAYNWLVSANADLWTATAGVNQDLGLMISGGAFGTGGTLVAWKESGGFAGTFSPNAAFVQTILPLAANTDYMVTLVWKANHDTAGTIYMGAGASFEYSPTFLMAVPIS